MPDADLCSTHMVSLCPFVYVNRLSQRANSVLRCPPQGAQALVAGRPRQPGAGRLRLRADASAARQLWPHLRRLWWLLHRAVLPVGLGGGQGPA